MPWPELKALLTDIGTEELGHLEMVASIVHQLTRKMNYLRNLASSPLAEELVERIDLPEIREAEDAFKQALTEIADPEARDRLDAAAGRISAAYQLLGFCVGHTAQSSEAFF